MLENYVVLRQFSVHMYSHFVVRYVAKQFCSLMFLCITCPFIDNNLLRAHNQFPLRVVLFSNWPMRINLNFSMIEFSVL